MRDSQRAAARRDPDRFFIISPGFGDPAFDVPMHRTCFSL